MTDKQLRKLSRSELLEMMLDLAKENETLRTENEALKAQAADRQIKIQKAGSLAEAALSLSGIFEAADRAAALFTENAGTGEADGEKLAEAERRCREADEAEARIQLETQALQDKKAQISALQEKLHTALNRIGSGSAGN